MEWAAVVAAAVTVHAADRHAAEASADLKWRIRRVTWLNGGECQFWNTRGRDDTKMGFLTAVAGGAAAAAGVPWTPSLADAYVRHAGGTDMWRVRGSSGEGR